MKKLLKNSLVLVVILTTMVSYSNELLFVTNIKTSEITEFTFNDVMEGSTLQLKDSKGSILYSESIKNSGSYTKDFDLTNLPDANYYFEIDNQEFLTIIPISVKENIAEILNDEKYTISKPEVIVKDNYVYLSKDFANDQSVAIDVYYEGNDLAYSENFRKIDSVNRIYDFSTSKKGKYLILVKAEGRVFKNSVTI